MRSWISSTVSHAWAKFLCCFRCYLLNGHITRSETLDSRLIKARILVAFQWSCTRNASGFHHSISMVGILVYCLIQTVYARDVHLSLQTFSLGAYSQNVLRESVPRNKTHGASYIILYFNLRTHKQGNSTLTCRPVAWAVDRVI